MIKINLLPTKKKPPKKVTDLQRQLILAVLVLVIMSMSMGYFWVKQNNRIKALERENKESGNRIEEQNKMLNEVKNVEEERKKVADKIEIIEQLKKNQSGPVLLLDAVSTALPKGAVITSLAENNNKVSIDGEAFLNDTIVRFIDNLKASPLLKEVMLLETSQATQNKIDIYKYKLQFTYKGL